MSTIRHTTFPLTNRPPHFVAKLVDVFQRHESQIGTIGLDKGLISNEVLGVVAADLQSIGFSVETSKRVEDQIDRPVFFGENGIPTLRYRVDAYHEEWRCGLEIEAGRAFMGNAFYRNIVQSMVMVEVDHLVVAVPIEYKYLNNGKCMSSRDY